MKKINDIFYSLQGEGHNTGRAAVFIRFAGCNLRCPFCDTEFDTYREMTDEAILQAIAPYPARFVVLTGGEPTLQVDEAFVDLLHSQGYEVAMESNGTRPAPQNLDWLTVSPKSLPPAPSNWRGSFQGKQPVEIKIVPESEDSLKDMQISLPPSNWRGCFQGKQPDEIKIVFESEDSLDNILTFLPPSSWKGYGSASFAREWGQGGGLYLQPCDTGDPQRNKVIVEACIRYIEAHPQWRLSLQTHKLIGFK